MEPQGGSRDSRHQLQGPALQDQGERPRQGLVASMSDAFFEEGSRLVTPNAFEFVLDGELKRAVRSQNFLTLVVLETRREWEGLEVTADDGMVEEVAQLVGREVRDTDLLGKTEQGTLSLVLLDADFDSSTRVIDRLVSRLGPDELAAPRRIPVRAGCYPRHA